MPKTVTIPAGTLLSVRVDDQLSSSIPFKPATASGQLSIGRLSSMAPSLPNVARGLKAAWPKQIGAARLAGLATLALELVRLNTSDGQRVRLQTEGFTKTAEKSTKKDAAKVGIGAGLGAAIGAIAGGGKGAAIGAGVGGAAGTGAVMASRGEAAEVPAETRMTFRLREPITLTEKFN